MADDGDDDAAMSDHASNEDDDGNINLQLIEYAYKLVSEYPLRKVVRKKGWKEQRILEASQIDHSEAMQRYVARLCDLPCCFNRVNKSFTDCNCLKQIQEEQLGSISAMLGKQNVSVFFIFFFVANYFVFVFSQKNLLCYTQITGKLISRSV
jgi:hypothetical protein